ncbi:MAG: condensation domain-containing protein, partial [Gemmatimonadales bacterium]
MHRTTDLTPARQALLAKWARSGTGGDVEITATALANGSVPLSFVQERQLFLEALDPGTAVNNLAVCLHMHGALDWQLLEQSTNRIIARHETLRTSFDLGLGRPAARIADQVYVQVGVMDLTDAPMGESRQATALQLAEVEARRPFDLRQAPLFRATAFRLAPDDHVLVIVVHHTVADGWSLGVLLGELFTTYRQLALNPDWQPEPLPIQYRDFAAWQREPRRAPLFEQQLGFWRDQLSGELSVLELPVDHPRPARQTFSGATRRLPLPQALTNGLKEFSRQCDATPFMVLMAGYQALLHRYGGQDDVLVGTPTAGRSRPETHPLIGAFINTLVLRTDFSGNPTFRELVGRGRAAALAAYAHQDLPFEQLVAELRPPRDLSRTPIFQALFIMHNSPLPDLAIPGLSVDLIHLDRGAAQFDLTLTVSESPHGLDTAFEYNRDLFEAATIDRFARSYLLLLEAAVAQPDVRVSALPLMTAAERHHLLVTLNDTAREYPRDLGLHQLIEAQARHTPDRIAVTCGGVEFTYRELDRWADRLADELQARGVGAGERVGVCLERSPDLIVALLAVLKAGAAYVPIDPATPADRVRQLLRGAGAIAVFACDAFEPPTGILRLRVTHPTEPSPPAAGSAPTRRRPAVTADQLAYVIFTSGSTGQPKGVLVNHAGLVNLLGSLAQRLELGADDVLLALTSITFDIAALELFLPLCVGARVILTTRDEARDPRRLQRAIAEHGVTVVQATPSLWRL